MKQDKSSSAESSDSRLLKLVSELKGAEEALRRYLSERVDALTRSNEASLRESAQRLVENEAQQRLLIETQSALLNAVPADIALLDHDGVILVVNKSWQGTAQAAGLDSAAFGIGQNYFLICEQFLRFNPQDAQRLVAEIKRVLSGESQGFRDEFLCEQDKSGDWIEITVAPIQGPQSSGAVIMHLGVTQRHSFEREIATQVALLDSARDGMVIRDLNHQILFWSAGAARLYGWSKEEAIGQHMPQLLKVDNEATKLAQKSVERKGEWQGEVVKFKKSGEPLLIDASWSLLRDARGAANYILSIETDITDKRRMEQQFLRAQRLESIGTLAGGIAHDLNNALAPALLSVQLLTEDETNPNKRRLLQRIEGSIHRSSDMVKQVLSFSRGVDGKRHSMDLAGVLVDVQKIATETFLKAIDVQLSIVSAPLWEIIGDSTQIHQVLLNLCVNSRDAMPNGGRLSLTAENLQLDEQYVALNSEARVGPHVLITVEDTGTGMSPEIMGKIFDPFFTTKDVGQGTGLGLATSQAIVKSHGGFMRVYSELGRGTTFKIYLPATLVSTEKAEPELNELQRGNGELVLVVDDEQLIRDVTSETLEMYGYRTICAADGLEAIALFAEQKANVSIILLDMMMPHMDAQSLIDILAKMKPKISMVAASGLPSNESRALNSHPAVKRFLAKPYTASTLLKTLQTVLHPR